MLTKHYFIKKPTELGPRVAYYEYSSAIITFLFLKMFENKLKNTGDGVAVVFKMGN